MTKEIVLAAIACADDAAAEVLRQGGTQPEADSEWRLLVRRGTSSPYFA
ncbi:MAG TPA: hypothetical protein VH558_04210 [Pseudolabrys sp.]